MPYRGVLLDLFGTLITFDPSRLPEVEIDGKRIRTTVAALTPLLAEWVPGTTPGEFLQAILAVSDEMAQARANDLVELPSRERFRRALERVGCDGANLAEAAVHMSRSHMRGIAAATVLPPAHATLLASLVARFRLAVVSNFDDSTTACDILMRHGIAPHLSTIVISEGLGLRKPHPALMRTACHGLELAPHETLMVGDTFAEDVLGAHAAGVDAVWIDAAGKGVPTGAQPPRFIVREFPELAAILGC
jgi:HAD superfamily hydrolase (TIGR01549 family)